MAEKKVKIEVDVEVKGGQSVDNLKDSIKDVSESGKNLPGVFGQISEAVGVMSTGIWNAVKASLAFIATPLGAVVAGITLAVVALKEAFTGSEEGQNRYAKLMGAIAAIGEKLMDVFQDMGETLIKAFDDPKQALIDFGTAVKNNISTRIEGLIELLPALGKAIKLTFQGDFSEAAEVAANAAAKVGLGIENISEKIKAFGKDIADVAQKAGVVADLRAKADKEEREASIKQEERLAKIAQLRADIADKESFNAEQRKEKIKEAQALSDAVFNQEEKIAKARLEAQKLENKYTDDNKENKQKLVDAERAVIHIQLERANAAKTLQKSLQTINNEVASDNKANNDKILADEKTFNDAKLALNKEAADKEKADIEAADQELLKGLKAQHDARLQVQLDYNDAKKSVQQAEFNATESFLGALSGLVGKNKALATAMLVVQKGLSIARIIIETTAAINANRASAAAVPAILPPGIPNPAFPAALAISASKNAALRIGAAGAIGTIIATGIGQVASINQSSDSGSGGGSVPSAGGSGGGSPNFSNGGFKPATLQQVGGNTPIISNGGSLGETGKLQPQKIYVVSSDITSSQNKDAVLERRASF